MSAWKAAVLISRTVCAAMRNTCARLPAAAPGPRPHISCQDGELASERPSKGRANESDRGPIAQTVWRGRRGCDARVLGEFFGLVKRTMMGLVPQIGAHVASAASAGRRRPRCRLFRAQAAGRSRCARRDESRGCRGLKWTMKDSFAPCARREQARAS